MYRAVEQAAAIEGEPEAIAVRRRNWPLTIAKWVVGLVVAFAALLTLGVYLLDGVTPLDPHQRPVARALRAGTVHVNQYDEDDITVPFGGFKQSGVGRDKSLHAFDKYTEVKTTWIRIDSPV